VQNKLQRSIVVNSMNALKFVAMQMKQVALETINELNKNTLIEHLGIEVIELGADYIVGRMPVDQRTIQPFGLLHGGASVVLIESLGSIGSSLLINHDEEFSVGLEVNANHVGAAKEGFVVATAKLSHGGRRTHVWVVEVHHEASKRLICTGRLTVMVVDKKR
jgi:1,4-dihydroxy-2-naphthoyl-CoA hydrolase